MYFNFFMFRDVPRCSGMFRNVPGCSMFRVLSTPKKCTKKLIIIIVYIIDARSATVVFMLKLIVFGRCRRGG